MVADGCPRCEGIPTVTLQAARRRMVQPVCIGHKLKVWPDGRVEPDWLHLTIMPTVRRLLVDLAVAYPAATPWAELDDGDPTYHNAIRNYACRLRHLVGTIGVGVENVGHTGGETWGYRLVEL